MDYVKKLRAAGVVRKSNSVFNSPLMLMKKPHADPNKPLAEQCRLVHNYVKLNKNIAPCSYPLRHLYELLDDEHGEPYFQFWISRKDFSRNISLTHTKLLPLAYPAWVHFLTVDLLRA